MKISSKVAELIDNGWILHDTTETVIGSNGIESKVPIGLKPGQYCREIDGLMLVYCEDYLDG